MKKLKKTILLITTSILLCACPKDENGTRYLTFVNKSEKRIDFQLHFLNGYITYEDTQIQCEKLVFGVYSDTLRRLSAGTHSYWENEMKGYLHLQILVIDAIYYDKYVSAPCDTIRKYVPVLHRYQLTLEDLQRMNWTVVYPPEE